MNDPASSRRPAIALMREAISMLDEAGDSIAAVHLQMAIDVAERGTATGEGDELPDDDADTPGLRADPALVRAIGGALAVMATLLARQGGPPLDEVANLLGIYATVTKETSAEEALLIACWGAMLRDAAEAQRERP